MFNSLPFSKFFACSLCQSIITGNNLNTNICLVDNNYLLLRQILVSDDLEFFRYLVLGCTNYVWFASRTFLMKVFFSIVSRFVTADNLLYSILSSFLSE